MGYNISSKGLIPTKQKIQQIQDFREPNDSKSLHRFLGLVNFYRKLIPKEAELLLPLTELIRYNQTAKSPQMNSTQREAFDNIKNTLAEIIALTHPNPKATQYHLVTDSSSYATGAALHQIVDDTPIPINFHSKKLTDIQKNIQHLIVNY